MAETIGAVCFMLILFTFIFRADILGHFKHLSDNKLKREQEKTQQKQLDLAIAQRRVTESSTTSTEE